MIHLCTCIGGSASTISSRKRRGGKSVSCKNCGGRPAIDRKSSLLSTVLELTSLSNSDYSWTKISKGCRSSSRRPRKLTTNTITLACGELLDNDSRDLEMPVSESEKLGVSVLGCHFSEKVEHIPIKKRRFLFKPPSPTHNIVNPSFEGAERNATSVELNSNVNPASGAIAETCENASGAIAETCENASGAIAETCENASGAIAETCESAGKDFKLDQNKLVKDDDFCGISILAAAACSNSLVVETDRCGASGFPLSVNHAVSKNVELNENIVKKEPDSHTSTAPPKDEESTLNNNSSHAPFELPSSNTNQDTSIQKSPARDARFSWDLNTVMDAWEEPSVNDHEFSGPDAAKDNKTPVELKENNNTKDNSESLPVELKKISHENKELRAEKCEPLSQPFEIAQNAVVVKTESMHDKHTCIPFTRTLSLENPTHGTFSNNFHCESSHGFEGAQAVNTKLSIDCSIPPGFNQCFDSQACEEKAAPTIKHDLSLKMATCMENEPHHIGVTSNKVDDEDMTKMELTSKMVVMEDKVKIEEPEQPGSVSSMHDVVYSNAENVGYGNPQSDTRAGGGMDKLDETLVGYDSQYEDGELRESTISPWKRYGVNDGQNEYDTNKIEDGVGPSILDAIETNSQNVQEKFTAIKKSTEVGHGKEAVLIPSVVFPEKLHNSDEALSGSGPYGMISCQEKSERHDIVQKHAARQSDEWKMNVSGWDVLPENQRTNFNNLIKTRNFTARKFSYREEQNERFDTEDVEMKAQGSRFSRRESLTRIGGPSTRDTFLSSGRFQMQRCSPKDGDDLTTRPERESGALRSFGRGRYSPHDRPSGRGSGLWNRSPGKSREGGPSFHRPLLEDSGTMDRMMNEGGMVPRRPFRSRSPMNQEVNDFRARLGLRPTGDTGHERFGSLSQGRGRGRSIRYDARFDGEGSRGRRYNGPASDECDDFITEYSNPFPRTRRCFSPIDRRENNNSYQHHQPDPRSPPRPRTRSPVGNSSFRRRSRSPGFRPDGRIRRLRSPTYRDHPSEYNSGPRNNNSSPPNSRWINYKERPVFNRSPPPGRANGPHEERFSFYDSRKPKQNEYYKSEHPGRYSDISEGGRGRPRYMGDDGDRPNNSYRRGGFVKRYNMDGPAKRSQYDEEDGFGRGFDARDRQALELHARSNSNPNTKPCNDGTDSRFRDFPRRQREDAGDSKRRSREGKDPKEESENVTNETERRPKEVKEVKDQSTTITTTSTNPDSMMPNDVVKEGENKPISGSN